MDHVTIGDSHVSVANLASDTMTVTDNGQTTATYPLSAGSTQYPTQDGIHIAMDKEPVVHMVSSTVGIAVNSSSGYDEFVYNDVHISDTGEYVHAAPWSTYAQGHENVSHGCINLSMANSLAFYNFSSVGDVIEVVGGTPGPGGLRSRRDGLDARLEPVDAGHGHPGLTATARLWLGDRAGPQQPG